MKKFVLIEVVEREISTPEFFDTYEDAINARKQAEENYWGDYRYDVCNS